MDTSAVFTNDEPVLTAFIAWLMELWFRPLPNGWAQHLWLAPAFRLDGLGGGVY
jgi:hypothetical protein